MNKVSLDETIDDVRKILEVNGKKCLLIYGDHGTENPVRVKYNATMLDLNGMAAAAVMCLATGLAKEFGYDSDTAVTMAIDSVSDHVRRLSSGTVRKAGADGGGN